MGFNLALFTEINGLKMSELVELGRRLKRSLDGSISYRRAAGIAVLILGTSKYVRARKLHLATNFSLKQLRLRVYVYK